MSLSQGMMLRNQKACRQALVRQLQPLREYVQRRLRHRAEADGLGPVDLPAEEVVAETFLVAWRRCVGTPGRPPSYGLLCQIARSVIGREVARLHERNRREVSLESPIVPAQRIAGVHPEEGLRLADVLPDQSAPLPPAVVEDEELQRCLERTFDQLPAAWREIFFLHAVDGFSAGQVAEMAGVPVEAILHSIEQTREFLRRRLIEEYGEAVLAA